MPSRYGVGRYGRGPYSSADTVSEASTVAVAISNTQAYQRTRDQKATLTFSVSLPNVVARKEANSKASLYVWFDITAVPTFVRNLNGDAILSFGFEEMMTGNYTTDAESEVVFAFDINMTAFMGPFWNPEPASGAWTPEVVENDIWVPETNHPSPWG